MRPEFRAWPKTPRLFRDMVITEKIDGTNACVIVQAGDPAEGDPKWAAGVTVGDQFFHVGAQSRNRVITPEKDNAGFARWVQVNAQALAEALGPGYHFGEWWGSGIQRAYGLTHGEKRFSLFNVHRYRDLVLDEDGVEKIPGVNVVPTLYIGPFTTPIVRQTLLDLMQAGSAAAPGYDNPEGLVVYHSASSQVYKVLIENDTLPKSQVVQLDEARRARAQRKMAADLSIGRAYLGDVA
ncbi:RNA ligase family protein [Micromonospora sp. GCM10011541]|uniref:RNA ligase family protein n=1 Tax=Micromonospora sp. GCM10011541 TaxID=3317336 RepID=UPI00362403E9